MTILEAIYSYHRIVCGICHTYFDLSAANYTRFEAARMLDALGWKVVRDVILCPDCNASWIEESKDDISIDK